jgi:hypothetical protein
MIAAQTTCSAAYVGKVVPLFSEMAKPKRYYGVAKGASKKHGASKKIMPLEEVVYIEGTVSVAF